MACCKAEVNQYLTHWGYYNLALNHRYDPPKMIYFFSYFPVLDKVSCNNDLVRDIPAARIHSVVLLATMCNTYHSHFGGGHAALYHHCQLERLRRTFIKGEWDALGLGKYLLLCLIMRH